MSLRHKPLGDFDVITGPPAPSRPVPLAVPPDSVAATAVNPSTLPPKPEASGRPVKPAA